MNNILSKLFSSIALLFFSVAAIAAEPALLESIVSLQSSSVQGDAESQFELGNLYSTGNGVSLDLEKAFHWFSLAGEQNNTNAQYNLGVMYMTGQGIEADFEKSLGWFQRAADLGDLVSQYSLGAMYANGRGVERDFAQAYKWFSIAAASGDPNAQANLVLFLEMLSEEQILSGQGMATQWIEDFDSRK
jgi:uncharacterized protein